MSYEPTQWKAGDTVTSAKLNKMEQGIAGGANILIAHGTQAVINNGSSSGKEAASTTTVLKLDKTAREILDADFTIIIGDGQHEPIFYKNFMYITSTSWNSETGIYAFVVFMSDGTTYPFSAATEDDYPVMILSDDSSDTQV